MSAERVLREIQSESGFTRAVSFEQFVEELCQRYARIYGEILPIRDYTYIVKRLKDKKVI